jgi:hypothetical protein
MFKNSLIVRNCTSVEKVHYCPSFDEVHHCASLEEINHSERAKTQPRKLPIIYFIYLLYSKSCYRVQMLVYVVDELCNQYN